jgi:hypothetical protein
MTTFNPADHPRDPSARFPSRFIADVPTPPAISLDREPEQLDGETGIWSPRPELTTVTQDDGDGSCQIDLRDGGYVSFDLRRTHDSGIRLLSREESHHFIDNLTVQRTGNSVSVQAIFTDLDFTQFASDVEDEGGQDAGEYLSDNQKVIEAWLKAEYGATMDNSMDWDCTNIFVDVALNAADVTGTDFQRVNTHDAETAVWEANDGIVRELQTDLDRDVFFDRMLENIRACEVL